ncbi:MAG: redox-sensing transcriptional repressor Rex [Actinomycetes bacterium]
MADQRRHTIPDATVARLPVYHRCLLDLEADGRVSVSSDQLAEAAGVNAAQVRKDLSYFGTYGTRGVGYEVDRLLVAVRRELGLTHDWPCVIVGAGNLGSALAKFTGFTERGFTVVGVVDIDPGTVGRRLGGLTVREQRDLPDLVERNGASIGVIATPPSAAQGAADTLVDAGVTSILNFAPVVLDVPAHVMVRQVDLSVELQILAFHEERRAADARRGARRATAG